MTLSELRADANRLNSSIPVDELLAYLVLLFPAKIQVSCNDVDVYEYFISNLDTLKNQSLSRNAVSLFLKAISEVCTPTASIIVEVKSPLKPPKTINTFEYALSVLKSAGVVDAEAFLLEILGSFAQDLDIDKVLGKLNITRNSEVGKTILSVLDLLKPIVDAYRDALTHCFEKLGFLSENSSILLGSIIIQLATLDSKLSEVSRGISQSLISRARNIIRENAYVLVFCDMYNVSLE